MTTKEDIFNIRPCPIGWQVNAYEEVDKYYARQKQEFIQKYKLKEFKQNKPKTALEVWNS
jgi:hypothetical protein